MKSSRLVVLSSVILIAPLGLAQKENQTQAQQVGFSGEVKSVATVAETSGVHWQQPSGPTLVIPVWCRDCEYSPDGYRTKSGQVMDGKFSGEKIALTRDGNGRVTGVEATDANSGDLVRQAAMGPFGRTDETFYQDGKVRGRNLFKYDVYGHVTDWVSLDGEGNQAGHTRETWSKEIWTERTVSNKTGQVERRETYDPEKDEQHYTVLDESGNISLAWTYLHGNVTSFWEPSDSTDQAGDSFVDFDDKANPKAFHCHSTGICDVAKVHYEYADAGKKHPLSAEWRDAGGNLLFAAYYSYQFDANGNWTHREISVWNAELGQRTPYETDDRLIAYWDK